MRTVKIHLAYSQTWTSEQDRQDMVEVSCCLGKIVGVQMLGSIQTGVGTLFVGPEGIAAAMRCVEDAELEVVFVHGPSDVMAKVVQRRAQLAKPVMIFVPKGLVVPNALFGCLEQYRAQLLPLRQDEARELRPPIEFSRHQEVVKQVEEWIKVRLEPKSLRVAMLSTASPSIA